MVCQYPGLSTCPGFKPILDPPDYGTCDVKSVYDFSVWCPQFMPKWCPCRMWRKTWPYEYWLCMQFITRVKRLSIIILVLTFLCFSPTFSECNAFSVVICCIIDISVSVVFSLVCFCNVSSFPFVFPVERSVGENLDDTENQDDGMHPGRQKRSLITWRK